MLIQQKPVLHFNPHSEKTRTTCSQRPDVFEVQPPDSNVSAHPGRDPPPRGRARAELRNRKSRKSIQSYRYPLRLTFFGHIFCRDLGTTSQNTLVPHTQSIEPQNPTRLGLPILPKSPILGLGLALGVGLGLGYFERSR